MGAITDLPALLLRDARHCLRHARSHAPAFSAAVQRWQQGQQVRLQRLRRMPVCDALRLLQAEQACLQAGLLLGGTGPGRCAPWHLDEALLNAPLQALPAHPLIDPHWLAGRLGGRADTLPALPALMRLLSDPAVSATHGLVPPGGPQQAGARARMAVCLHLYYPETWPEFEAAFAAIPERFDLFITLPSFAATPVLAQVTRSLPGVRVLAAPNRGRDVLPFLRLLAGGHLDGYDWVCKLHSKKSPHMAAGNAWRQRLLDGLLGPRERITTLLQQLRSEPTLGLWAPAEHWMQGDDARWLGTNGASMQRMSRLTGLTHLTAGPARPPYVAGTMFWVRPTALQRLRALGRQPAAFEAFEPEHGQTDGTLAHAVERGVALDVLASGQRLADFTPAAASWPTLAHQQPPLQATRP